jgi:hypothetical protein
VPNSLSLAYAPEHHTTATQALEYVSLEDLKAHALDLEADNN